MGKKGRGKSNTAAVKPAEPEVPIEEPVPEPPEECSFGDKRLQKQREKEEREEKEQLERQAEAARKQKHESKTQGKKKSKQQRIKLDRSNGSESCSQPTSPAKKQPASEETVPRAEIQNMKLQEASASSQYVEESDTSYVKLAARQDNSHRSSDSREYRDKDTRANRGQKTVYANTSRTQASRDGDTSHFRENRSTDNREFRGNSDSRGGGEQNDRSGYDNQRSDRSHPNSRADNTTRYKSSGGYGGRNHDQQHNTWNRQQQKDAGAQGELQVGMWSETDQASSGSADTTLQLDAEPAAGNFTYSNQQHNTAAAAAADTRHAGQSQANTSSAKKTSRWDRNNSDEKKRKNDYEGDGRGGGGNNSRGRGDGRWHRDGHHDAAYAEFDTLCSQTRPLTYGKLVEETGDLFDAPYEYSLAHCVAEDMSMGAGIAKSFRTKFGRVAQLLQQRASTGGLAVLTDRTRQGFIYYLVTKQRSYGKPTMYTLWLSLNRLKEHCHQHQVTKLAIPQIGCGLDRLVWSEVKQMLEYVFRNMDMEIVVYSLDGDVLDDRRVKKAYVNHQRLSLVDIAQQTGHIYFGYVDGTVTQDIDSLTAKFNILTAYRTPGKQIGDVIRTEGRPDIVYGMIVSQTPRDPLDFEAFDRCLRQLAKFVKKDEYNYVGFQAFVDPADPLIVDKIVTLMQYILRDVELWVCWPKDIEQYCPLQPVRG